ncbi:MAG TPA: sigma-70 family RNA polymerase sigma factor [Acidimicrobiia bacterium]|nr:sigma-70 family RNA polymerase sigma factor [Acidimicrobiia bacterium]
MSHSSSESGRRVWPPAIEDVIAARDGDMRAMGDVLGAGHPRLVAFYHGVGLPYDLVGEIVADALEGMVRNFSQLREPDAFEGWFWAIARNRMRTALRRYRSPNRPQDAFVSPTTPEERTILSEEHTHIRAALALLSARDRELLWLREVEGLDYEDIGSRLGATVGAVRVSCHRARKRLEEAFIRLEGSE